MENDGRYNEVYGSIDWGKVSEKICEGLGIDIGIEFVRKGDRVEMRSENIIDRCGIFGLALSSCYVSFFSNRLYDEGDCKFWGNINLSYPGNGMNIGEIWVMLDGEIKMDMVDPR